MTTPAHISSIPAGGILTQHVDSDWADYAAGRPLQQRVCVSVVQPGKIAAGNTQKGRSKGVGYEDVHFVEVTDPHEADKLRRLITQIRADRGLLASQPALFDLTDAEQCESLLDLIKDYASLTDTPMVDLDQQWLTYFGGPEHANSETVQACRSPLLLKEFAFHIGAISEGPDGELDEDEGEDPEPEPVDNGVPGVPFQDTP